MKIAKMYIGGLVVLAALLLSIPLSGCHAQPEQIEEPQEIAESQDDDPTEPDAGEENQVATDTIQLPGTDLIVEFLIPQKPSSWVSVDRNLPYRVLEIFYDDISGNWAILYAESTNSIRGGDPWGAGAILRTQFFNENGEFLRRLSIAGGRTWGRRAGIRPYENTIESVEFADNVFSYIYGEGYLQTHVFFNLEREETTRIRTDPRVVDNDLFFSRTNRASGEIQPGLQLLQSADINAEVALTLDFVRPASRWQVFRVVHNEERDEWAVIYARRYLDFGPFNQQGTLMVQIFDGQGNFLHITNNTNEETCVEAWQPSIGNMGRIEFRLNDVEILVFSERIFSFASNRNLFAVDRQSGDINVTRFSLIAANGRYMITWDGGEVLTLLLENGEVVGTLEMPPVPWFLVDDFGSRHLLELALGDDRIATMSSPTVTITFDFYAETTEVVRHYTLEDLDDLVAASELWELYNANIGGFNGGFWGETVLHNKRTGEFVQLHEERASSAAFAGENLLLVSEIWGLLLFDVNERRVVRNLLPSEPGEWPDIMVNGVAFDPEKEWFVVAWLDNDAQRYANYDEGSSVKTNIMLNIYSMTGDLIRTIDTGVEVEIPIFHLIFTLELELILDGQGNAMFRNRRADDAVFESVRYWE